MEGEEPNAKRPRLGEQQQPVTGSVSGSSETVSSSSEPATSSSIHCTPNNVTLQSSAVPPTPELQPSTTGIETVCVSSSVAIAETVDKTPIGHPYSNTDSKLSQMNRQASPNVAPTSSSSVSSVVTQASGVSSTPAPASSLHHTAAQSSNISSSPSLTSDTSTSAPIIGISSSHPSVPSNISPGPAANATLGSAEVSLPVIATASSTNPTNIVSTASMCPSPALSKISSPPVAASDCPIPPTSSGIVSSTAASGGRVSSAAQGSVSSSGSAHSVLVLKAEPHSSTPVTGAQQSASVSVSELNVSSSVVLPQNTKSPNNPASSSLSSLGIANQKSLIPESSESSQVSKSNASGSQKPNIQSSDLSNKNTIKEPPVHNVQLSTSSSTEKDKHINIDPIKPSELVKTISNTSISSSLLSGDIQKTSTVVCGEDKPKAALEAEKSHFTDIPNSSTVQDSVFSLDSACKESKVAGIMENSTTPQSVTENKTCSKKSIESESAGSAFLADDLPPTSNAQLSADAMTSSKPQELAIVNTVPVPPNVCSPVLSSPKVDLGGISFVPVSSHKIEVGKVSSIIPSEEKSDHGKGSTKSAEVECMEVDAEPGLGKALASTVANEKMETDEIDTAAVDEANNAKKSILESQVTDNSMFLDDESCETILRKPEPVTNIREETLAGDPRLEVPESMSGVSSLQGSVDESSMDMTKTLGASEASLGAKDDDNDESAEEEEEEEEVVTKKTPKKRKKPRRSVFSRKRTDKKKKEKENETDSVSAASNMDAVPTEQGMTQASLPAAASPAIIIDEDSQGSGSNKEKKEVRRFRCEVVVPESTEAFTVEKVMEYVWPLEGGYGETYFVQEHISQYIGISSFKRKYPDLRRRPIDMAERDYLKELGMVSEIACDMGLMAVRSEDVMDVLFADFPAKFEELTHIMAERRDRQLKERGKVEYQVADIDKSKLQEYGRRAAEEAARYNAALNREKKEERRYSFDLQSFTLHRPLGQGTKLPPSLTKVGHYPVAVLPGQYTDQYKKYSSAQLRRLPLNSVCSGPLPGDTAPEEPVAPGAPTSTEASNTAQDSKNGIATIKTEEAPAAEEKVLKCKVCSRGKDNNKSGKAEGLIVCAKCSSASHASCVELNPAMIPRINSYGWQCMDCKNCMQCSNSEDEEKMIFCDLCDRGYHIYCVGLKRVPHGRWHCKECAVCNTCGSTSPSAGENIKNPDWQHEFRKNRDNNKIAYATTLCMPCDRLWKRRQYCYVCLKVYRSVAEDNMIRCANCPKYIHKEGGQCSALFEGEYLCVPCFKSSNTTVLNHNRIIAAAKKKMASGY